MAATLATAGSGTAWWNWSWRPTSAQQLAEAESLMLSTLKLPFDLFMVELPNGEKINTLKMGSGPPLVMIHGFAGGLALFAANLEHLAETRTVYAIDLPGFGRSSRPDFKGKTTAEAEAYFVDAFDAWMTVLGFESAEVMGHSFGAYLSASWALSHPHRFKRLIMVDPFGVPRKPAEQAKMGIWRKMIIGGIQAVSSSPLTLLRAAGPWGPGLITKLRPDLIEKFQHLHPDPAIVASYIYHVNAQAPATGEMAFTKIMTGLGYAADPLIDRLPLLDRNIPVSFIYGADSWMKPLAGVALKESMPLHNVDFVVIPDAGHHVYVDQWHQFNQFASIALNGNLGAVSRLQYRSLVAELARIQDVILQQQLATQPIAVPSS
jgi:abhydrolase domain-containing protein 4